MRYEKLVQKYCGPNWRDLEGPEKMGGFGVACMLAFIDGKVDANVDAIAGHLEVTPSEIQVPFVNLLRSGLFYNEFNARNDVALNGNDTRTNVLCAWGHVAGIAGGLIFRNMNNSPKMDQYRSRDKVRS